MEKKEFKSIIQNVFTSENLVKKGSYYYFANDEIICAVGLQRSNFSNSYYVNVGYIIRELNPKIINPRDVDGDIRARFRIELTGKKTGLIDLDLLNESNEEDLKKDLLENINELIVPASSLEGLKDLIKSKPELLNLTTLTAKKFLGYTSR